MSEPEIDEEMEARADLIRKYGDWKKMNSLAITYIPDDIDDLFERLLLRKISEKDRAWLKESQDSWSAWKGQK